MSLLESAFVFSFLYFLEQLYTHDDGVFNERVYQCMISDQESDDDIASINSKDNDDDDAADDDDE